MGQTKSRSVVHFKGTSYIYDFCVDRHFLIERASIIKHKADNRRVRLDEYSLSPVPDYAGLGFVNSFLLVFFSNDNIGKFLRQVAGKQEGKQPKNFMEYLGLIYRMLSSGGVVLPALISDFMRFYFADYFHFELTMA